MYDGRSIFLLDSNALEAETLKQVLQELSIDCPVVHCSDSLSAMEYLTDEFDQSPCLILMNVHASGMPGLDFLKWIKSHEELQVIPTIALADRQKEHFVDACFSLGAVGYIVKSEDYECLKRDMSVVVHYWKLSRLPSGHSIALELR